MDGNRFDHLVRKLGVRSNRRTVVRGMGGGALAAIGVAALASDASAKNEKVLVCHYTASTTNPYTIIEVAANAVAAHEAHGDHLAFDCGNGPQCTSCPPAVCTVGIAGVVGGNAWTVCRADAGSAWLSADFFGQYDPVVACQSLGYSSVGQWGGTFGNVCGHRVFDGEGTTSCANPGTEYYSYGVFDGVGNYGGGIIGNAVMWECLA